MPTLLCRTSSPPQRPVASATIASQSVLRVTSAAKATASPCSARMRPTVSSARSFCASTQSTRAPSRAMRIAAALPLPTPGAARARARHDRDLAGESFAHWGRVLLGPYNALGTARPARLRPRALRLRDHAPGESLARPRLARRHGGWTRLLPRAVAQPGRLAPSLWLARHPRGAGILGALPAPHAAHAAVGGGAARARTRHPAAARQAHRRHAPRVAGLRRRGCLFAGGAQPLGVGARARRPAGA